VQKLNNINEKKDFFVWHWHNFGKTGKTGSETAGFGFKVMISLNNRFLNRIWLPFQSITILL
jgi:hypothetical protein